MHFGIYSPHFEKRTLVYSFGSSHPCWDLITLYFTCNLITLFPGQIALYLTYFHCFISSWFHFWYYGPAFFICVPTRWCDSLFYLFGENLIFLKNIWSHHLFLFYFLKGKQKKKDNPKCVSLFGKDSLWKTKVMYRDQVTYLEGTVKKP